MGDIGATRAEGGRGQMSSGQTIRKEQFEEPAAIDETQRGCVRREQKTPESPRMSKQERLIEPGVKELETALDPYLQTCNILEE